MQVLFSLISTVTNSSKRAKGLVNTIRTFAKWWIRVGYFTQQQLESISRVVRQVTKESNYKAATSLRVQSKLYCRTDDSAGGKFPHTIEFQPSQLNYRSTKIW
jgi:hypothetical protein